MKHETGQLVLAFTGHYLTKTIIAIDRGHYPNTKLELNVRLLEVIDEFDRGISSQTKTVEQVSGQEGYGCGWGCTSKLYPITDALAKKVRAEMETEIEKPDEPTKPSPMDKMICPRCGTVCYSDCQDS